MRAGAAGERDGLVGAMRIDDDDFVGPLDRFERALDVGGLVPRDDRDGQLHTGSVTPSFQLPAASFRSNRGCFVLAAGSRKLS